MSVTNPLSLDEIYRYIIINDLDGTPPSDVTLGVLLLAMGAAIAGNNERTEKNIYMPNVVVGGQDEYATIMTYMENITNSGQNNLVLPPGQIGTQLPLQPPIGFTLKASGMVDQPNGTGPQLGFEGGTQIVPATGFSPTALVQLVNKCSGLQDIQINAYPLGTSTAVPYGLQVQAPECRSRNIGVYGATTTALDSNSSSTEFTASDIVVRTFAGSNPASTVLALNAQGTDWSVANSIFSGGTSVCAGADDKYANCHFVGNSQANAAGSNACVEDYGAQTFNGCTVDTVAGTSDVPLIDRSNATRQSVWNSPRFVQGPAAPASSPMIQETTHAGAGILLSTPTFGTAPPSPFTYFIKGVTASGGTIVNGVDIGAAWITGGSFADAYPAGSSFNAIMISGVLQNLGGAILGSNAIIQALASAPTYVKGGMYYDTTLSKLRIGGATAWETVTSS